MWRQYHPITKPSARLFHTMAYDPPSQRTLLFGGDDLAHTKETWAWDGHDWTLLDASMTLGFRLTMVFDRVRGEMLLFNGSALWSWTGSSWMVRYQPIAGGPALENASTAWDERGGRLLAFGESPSGTDETWAWDGSMWTRVATSGPTTRATLSAATDGRVLAVTSQGATWLWGGTAWTLQPSSLGTVGQMAMAHNRSEDRTVLFGGQAATFLDDTWKWTGTQWEQQPDILGPPVSITGAMASFVARDGVAWQFVTQGPDVRAWRWDGLVWAPWKGTHPFLSAMVETREGLLGLSGTETYLFVNGTWTSSAAHPALLDIHYLAYDASRDRAIALGADNAGPFETWEWDGTQWTLMSSATAPPYREGGAFTFDRRRQRAVLIGGRRMGVGTSGEIMDTWEWDGTDWIDRSPSTMPEPRRGAAAVYHPLRGTVVLHGGSDANGRRRSDTWEWDGTEWRLIEPVVAGPERSDHTMFFDALRGELIVFGGLNYQADDTTTTFALRFSSASSPADRCGATDTDHDSLVGCADPDCWARCTPDCSPLETCVVGGPHCGDGACDAVEDSRVCPTDCL